MDTAGARDYFADLQTRIVARLEALDGSGFARDAWTRDGGGWRKLHHRAGCTVRARRR